MTDDLRARLDAALGAAYTIERELGGGGMSRVFLAEETRLGRRVVVKLLSPELGAGVSAERFEREIQLAARLQHPHIVPLLAAGDVDGLPYYTMPFVAGASLRERMHGGPIPSHEAQGILRDVAQGARVRASAGDRASRHQAGERAAQRRHGDGRRLRRRARASAPRRRSPAAARRSRRSGTQIGTPAYMAPEQAAGDPDVDFRADLYAFGVMAYELLAGQHPFAERRTAHALVVAHMTETPKALTTHTTTVVAVDGEHRDAVSRQGSARAARRARRTIVAALDRRVATPVPTPCRRADAARPARRSPCCRSRT